MLTSYSNVVVEQISGKDHILNHLSIPAACFTHPEISMVGLTEVSYLLIEVVRSVLFRHSLLINNVHEFHWVNIWTIMFLMAVLLI
jgi:hypothetical protein